MITAQKIIDMLNEALSMDPGSMHALVETRVVLPNPQPVIDHPLLIPFGEADGTTSLGMLGILNGIVRMTGDLILAHYNDVGMLTRFSLKERNGHT